MSRIVEGKEKWSAVIRCAHPCGGYGNLLRVDGCFALIEITLDDIEIKDDGDGSVWYETHCPACGQILYPAWQIGDGPMIAKQNIKKGKNS